MRHGSRPDPTKAVPNGDGSYALSGTKIFISAGEHDLAENIVHLVLARIEGAPEGTKGISLFVVPKRLVGRTARSGRERRACGSLERKMGIHGNATCVMNYDGARGWLVGEANRGLQAMFVMMNEARLGVAIQGLAQSEVAYQNAAAYAKERLQGRSLTGPKAPDRPADPIIVHPDIRRTLLTIRAFNEAARALVIWTALQSDIAHRSSDEAERRTADDYMGLMTPLVKGVLTDLGFDNAVKAQQMFGGHGYIEEWGMSQFVRDARIAMIYEGANGIQAMDLVGRKLGRTAGAPSWPSSTRSGLSAGEPDDENLKGFVAPLQQASATSSRLPCGSCRTPWPSPTTRARAPPTTCTCSASWPWATCGPDGQGRAGEEGGGRRRGRADGRQARDGPLLHGADAAGNGTRLARIQAGADAVMALPAEMF
jgi:alkylation response protein AidB-like acyl-CoA dehydrogenase